MSLLLLPFMLAIELALLLAVLLVGLVRPRYGLNLNDWINRHGAFRDRYWGMSMSVPSRREVTVERTTPS
jgi:hypothetical protein